MNIVKNVVAAAMCTLALMLFVGLIVGYIFLIGMCIQHLIFPYDIITSMFLFIFPLFLIALFADDSEF